MCGRGDSCFFPARGGPAHGVLRLVTKRFRVYSIYTHQRRHNYINIAVYPSNRRRSSRTTP